MTTIILDDPIIESNYTSYELKLKFLNFIKNELKEDSLQLYQISIEDLPVNTLNRYKNIDTLNFV